MKNRLWLVFTSLFLFGFGARASDIVINEIMYHPFHTAAQAEDTGREWVEIFNRGTNAVSLHNWKLSKGVDFTFTNVTLAPGAYLVVAASRTNFLAQYPGVTNVVGDWVGRLGNTDDELRLLDASGEIVNRVAYADSGDWAIRARESADAVGLRGWTWLAPHDGEGMSLELINPLMPNQYGQNWAASAVLNGTPGAVNSVLAADTAPFIQDVSHFPLVPRSTETVTITARIDDEQTNGLTVTLFYRNATSASPPAFTTLTMFDDGAHGDNLAGDGLYGATIPALASGTVVEFYVSATDSGARNRRWPAPSRNSPDLGGGVLPPESGANALYQVDDSAAYTGTQPFYRMIMIESERAFLANIQGSLRNSDASANGTFVSLDVNSTDEHHLTSYRRRGAGSRGAAIPNYRVNFATDHRWKGVVEVNLNSQYTHAQVAGAVLSALAGLHAEFQKPVQVRVNSANLVNLGSPQFGSYAQQEGPDGDYAKNHFPDDSNGNIYRGSSGNHTATLAYLGTDPNVYIANGYGKTSNGGENDWSDLINLTDVLNNTPDNNYVQAVRQRLNVDQWMIYFAVFTLLDSKETSLGVGDGDDFELYRGVLDTRFQVLGHDYDTVLGQGDTGGNPADDLFRATTVPVINRFMKQPEFAPVYYRTLTNLLSTAFSPEQVSATLDQHLGSWVSAGVIANMKSFSVSRNAGVLAQIPLNISISHALPVQNGYPRATLNSATLFGSANAIETRSVLVNGSPATWSAWNARWTNNVTLRPGINRVLVQSLDANGREFERSYLDVWFDSGGVVNVAGDINDTVTWTPAGGPYNVTASIGVTDGGELTIQPGTTVYIAPGASITVSDSGHLFADGTDTQHIRFGKNPAVAGNWGSLDFINAPSGSRLAYVDFDSAGGTTIGGHNAEVHVNESSILIDHCSWPATPAIEYISFDHSSFIVQNCVFPSYPQPLVNPQNGQPEMLHGVNGIPAGGYGIFRDNYFGHTWGFNDTIDFTGGQRPGPILQVIGNVFDGASDDCLDLDSTDAWIEGNVFMHVHRDPARTDQAIDTGSAISGGVDVLGQNSDWTILNNLFYDVDHVFLNKGNSTTIGNGGGRVAFLYNTVAHVAKEYSGSSAAEIATFDWSDDNIVLPDPNIGSGMYAAHNIIYDAAALHRFYNPANHTVIMDNNIFPVSFLGTSNQWNGAGAGNQYIDPRLNLGVLTGIAVSNVTVAQLRQAFQLRPGSPAIGAGFGARDLGGSGAHGIAIAGEPIGTNTAMSAILTVGPGGTFNWGTNAAQPWGWTAFKWKLDGGAWSAVIPVTNNSPFNSLPTISLNGLSQGAHTVYVSGRNDAGYFQDDTFVYPTNSSVSAQVTASRTWTVNTNLSRLVINEVLAHNSSLLVDGKFSDLIELHNAGANPVDLSDMSLTDDPAQPRKFIFPPGTVMAADEYLVLYAASGEAPGHIYLSFSLNDSGEGVYLYNQPANGGTLLDSVVFGLQLPDLSIGRLADGTWALTQPTFGSANIAQPTGEPARLRINEWLAASGEIFQQDFIELFNGDSLPVPLGGLALSHSPMSSPRESVIPSLSFIAGRGWQTFIADGNDAGAADHVNFSLSAEGGWISLAQTNGTLIDMIVYATQFPDISQGRSPDGTANFISFNQPTPGGGNPGQTIVISSVTATLVPMTKTWRMEASGNNLGTAWRATNFNDTTWFSGPALFYNYDGGGSQVPPIPVGSTIPFTNPKQQTVYFRTTFTYSGPVSGVNFQLSQVIDDGCVLYLNNQEVYRYNLPAGVISFSTPSSTTISGAAALMSGIPISLPNLLQGTNYLAIEVHQPSAASSDMAMAIQIDSQQLVTNYLGTPIVLSEVFTKNESYTNASGKVVDWVELHNPSTNIVDISDLSLTDNPNLPRRWVFPSGAAIPAGGYYVVEFDDSAPYSPFNAGFELSADSGAVYLFHRPTAGGALLDSVVYGVQVADLTLGRATPGQNSSWTLCQPTRGAANITVPLGSAGALKINEWMPNPSGGDEDWFELYNPGAQPVALGGLHLTDDSSNPIKHTIRPLSFIGSGAEGYLKFFADDNTAKGADHVNFKLANTEAIGLYTTNAVPTQINFVSFTNAQNGVSYGRLPDGSSNIVSFPDSASPEEANWLPLTGSVVINETLTHATTPLEQAIEIFNPGDVNVAIGGWFLSNAKKDLKRFQIPAGTIVIGGGFKVFYEAQFNPSNDVPPSFAFNSSKADELYLSVADANGNLTGYRTSVQFGAAASGVAFGRYEKSTGDDFVAISARTFGTDNPATLPQFRTGLGAANAYPLVGPLVINEIHYHPPDIAGLDNTLDEFIEILNASASPVPLYDPAHPTNSWHLRDAVDFNFPTNVMVPAWDYVLVVSFDPTTNATALASFRAKYGLAPSVIVLGPWSGKLDNSSDSIELLRPDAPVLPPSLDAGQVPYILVERVKYSDSQPWPAAADGDTNGLGLSLQRLLALDYGNDPVNWIAGAPTPAAETGPAANQSPTINAGPTNVAVAAGNTVTFSVNAAGAGPLIYQWRLNGAVISNATSATLVVPNVQAANAGRYSVTVANKWGATLGGPARLTVQAPPQISQQPQSRTVTAGANTTFIVTASGGSLQYQWRFNGTNIASATNAALPLSNVQPLNAGNYDVLVSNALGGATSIVATLTVLTPPSITAQPQSVAVVIGNPASFTATASGTAPLSYQWRLNGVNLAGATSNSLSFASAQVSDGGNYTLVVTNAAGATTSLVATLTVIVPPTVTVIASDAFASEPGANTGAFTFTRTGSAAVPLVVNYTVSGSAGAGSDYIALSGTVTIPAGAAATNVVVTALNDALLEGDETVIVTLTASPDYLIGSPASATVVIQDDDNQLPTISILTPTNTQLFLITPTDVNFTVSANDPDGSIAKVEFFADATNKLGESTLAPFNFTWTNALAGSNTLTARATDNLGSTAVSAPVAVVLNALPSVAIISPVNGSTFGAPATFAINAFASDSDGSVTQVIFYANATLIGTDTNAPFTVTLSGAASGSYALRAVAFDDRGVTSTSAVVSVTVNQPGVFDDFDPDIDLSQWSAFGDAANTLANSFGGSASGTRSLWFGGDLTRSATTRSVDTTLGGIVAFQLRIADGGSEPWENADQGEDVVLEYSVNGGGAWVIIDTFPTGNFKGHFYPLQYPIPGGAQSASTLFRWRQLTHSGACCDHWALDDVQILVGPTPPTIATQPLNQFSLQGGIATFSVTVFGSSPLSYQWRFNGTNLPNATNATLTLNNIATNQAGPYSVFITNVYGTTTSTNASLTVIESSSEYFKIVTMSSNNPSIVDHYNLTGYDSQTGTYGRGGIGVSSSQVFVNGGMNGARFSAANLTGGTSLGTRYDALITDLRTETVYCFGTNTTGPAIASAQSTTLTHLLELNPNTGLLTGNAIPLSLPITLRGAYGNYGFFSGYGRAVVSAGRRVFHVALPTGAVSEVGDMNIPQHNSPSYSQTWGYWGLAESTETGLSLVYGRDSQSIVRVHVPDGATTNLATFSNLGYYTASLSFSITRSRWYFEHYGSSQFFNGIEVLGSADAQFTLGVGGNLPPTIVVAPQSAQALLGGRASFAVSAVGGGALSYQWRFNDVDLPNSIAPGLAILNVQPDKVGNYSVVVSNAFGSITTAPVALSIALPPAITGQPQGSTVLAGTSVTFSVTNNGDGPFLYQWRFQGGDILNATNSSYTLNTGYYNNGNYSVEVRNAVGVVFSANATLVVLSPPFFNTQPLSRQVLLGMNAAFITAVDGSAPIALQWTKENVPLPGANSATLTVTNPQFSDSGNYRLVATNLYGAVTSVVATLAVLDLDTNSFAIQTLTTNNAIVRDVYAVVGFVDHNGLAASSSQLFLNGYGTSGIGPAGMFSATDLSGGTSVGGARDGLVSDLRSRKVYSLANGNTLIGSSGGTVTTLVELDANGQTTATVITLSTNVVLSSSYCAVFSGYGRIALMDSSSRVYDIALPSGQVTFRGTMNIFNYQYALGYAYRGWGIVEQIGTNIWLAHSRTSQIIERSRVPDGFSETIATFSNLGSYSGNFTVCLPRNRWYFNYLGSSQFPLSGNNNLVSASASFVYLLPTNVPPSFIEQPVSLFPPVSSTAVFNASVDGGGLRYQWLFQSNALPSQTNLTLTLTNVHSSAEGSYALVVSNPAGVITSAVVTLTVNYGASSSNTVPLFALSGSTWRYNQSAVFNTTNWIGSNYNDSAWPSGPAGLAVENNGNITPFINTVLTLGRTSYYFRTWFNVPTNLPAGTMLRATTLIDDGAVIYFNGHEVQRVRMAAGTVLYTTLATGTPSGGDAAQETFVWPAAGNLVAGSNVVAVEVHQNAISSSDIVWAMALDALVPVLNRPPRITNQPVSLTVSNGVSVALNVGANGTAPLSYQWKHEGTNLPGATAATLALNNVQRRHGGVYVAQVSNPYDVALSSNATVVVVVPPIQFVPGGATFSAPGHFTLNFLGDAGAVFAIETSTNLLDWTQSGTVTNISGAAQYDDANAGAWPYRFYRLRLLP